MIINTEEDYLQIDELILEYQNGNNAVTDEIINTFEPYMIKYINLFYDGEADMKDKDVRQFMSLFVGDPKARKRMKNPILTSTVEKEINTVTGQFMQLFEYVPREDISQELKMILLTMAKRWKKKGPKKYFCGYLYNSYRYEMYRLIQKLMKEPLIYKVRTNISIEFSELEMVDTTNFEQFSEKWYNESTDNEFNQEWIDGNSCDDIFAELEPLQRKILIEYYINGLNTKKISQLLGIGQNTISVARKKAVQNIIEKTGIDISSDTRIKKSKLR